MQTMEKLENSDEVKKKKRSVIFTYHIELLPSPKSKTHLPITIQTIIQELFLSLLPAN